MLVRLQAEINESEFRQIRDLQEAAGIKSTQKEVVANAISFLSWAAQKKTQGCAIIAESKDGHRIEFEMPFLQAFQSTGIMGVTSKKD